MNQMTEQELKKELNDSLEKFTSLEEDLLTLNEFSHMDEERKPELLIDIYNAASDVAGWAHQLLESMK